MTLQSQTAKDCLALDGALTLVQCEAIATHRSRISVTPALRERCARAHARLEHAIAEQRHIYGITTGFGPLANRLIGADQGAELQQNLIYHLATGVGPKLSWAEARALMLARLNSILQGASGASPETIDRIVAVLNAGFAPEVPAQGTVGASGDLTPLAHMVLALQGRGRMIDPSGRVQEAGAVMDRLCGGPLTLAARDGLALVNGTSAMTAIAALTGVEAARAIDAALRHSAVLMEVLSGHAEAWHPAFAELRPHPGQLRATERLAQALDGAGRVCRTLTAARRLTAADLRPEDHPAQDAYSLRVVPQLVGAVWDTLDWHDRVVTCELNSVTDNPIFPEGCAVPALHGGNFMGVHVALASDALNAALVTLAGLVERQIARLTDEKLNKGLPAFLHGGQAGLQSGFMGAQVTATALLAEMRANATPVSVQSLSTNGANQDVVSMGTIAARRARAQLLPLSQIQAILALALAQAMDLLDDPEGQAGWSLTARDLRDRIRAVSPGLRADRPLAGDIEAVAQGLRHPSAAADPPA
ncbi:HAL/PAL/TAL family ammonia-lyase [Rhodobacter capsulatus]|uniref:HAL/PAL/TAL family ammonia-lyase n=1 Tax=Rhodobacter capsulatus TaxID=1061 RepID=UPI0003D2B052|nr:aromatic amino acid ammonia-lyase [Rhodobacter capsulatus]ETD02281.1 histidine ammonia-lyase [Rhodobacter capsulatus DE442]ETD78364.1 histidine ammonia-lyase [Rhodobacter capsulatus R121]ETE54479.1 histidine ammonia-lyase [Rhodobacter capsulatus Y262]MDS0925765.1 aromatic amino acid ammonia-lyase [Rhodobacter capsulatus]